MSFEDDLYLGMGGQELGRRGEGIAGVGTNVGFIIVEVGILHVSIEQLLDRRFANDWGRRWRNGDGNARSGIGGAAWSSRGNCIGGGIRRRDASVALRRRGADSRRQSQ